MSTLRMSGLISNMDTDSIVQSLMDVQRLKVTKVQNKKTLVEWKQEKWKDLNTKLYKLYQEQTSKLHLQSNYKVNSGTSSDESVVKVIAGKDSPEGTHNIAIKQLASSQFVTGNKLSTNATSTTKLKDLVKGQGFVDIVTKGGDKTTIAIDENTTISDFVSACKKAGLNANFDEKQQRFFISSASSGEDNAFQIISRTYSDNTIFGAKNKILDLVAGGDKSSVMDAIHTIEANQDLIGENTEQVRFMSEVMSMSEDDLAKKIEELKGKDTDDAKLAIYNSVKTINDAVKAKASADAKAEVTKDQTNKLETGIRQAIKDGSGTYKVTVPRDGFEKTYEVSLPKLSEHTSGMTTEEQKVWLDNAVKKAMETADMKGLLQSNIEANLDSKVSEKTNAAIGEMKTALTSFIGEEADKSKGSLLNGLGIGDITVNSSGTSSTVSGCTCIEAKDAMAEYNGVELTSSSNMITANGITFEAINLSEMGADGNYKPTSVTISKDNQANYDMVKNFIKEYNSILKELNTLYDAPSSRGYDPLTDEEKDAMSEKEVDLWEKKIKDSILRRDDTVGGIASAMKMAMSSTVEVDGKKYSLSTFGITTSRDYSEKGLLHIYGDKDDATYADKEDKLLAAFNEDPETVSTVLAGIVDNLHTALNEKMSKTSLSSALTFYNDKGMNDKISEYKKSIATLEDKLDAQESAYYKQFTAMEKALAKLQEQQSALSGLLGM